MTKHRIVAAVAAVTLAGGAAAAAAATTKPAAKTPQAQFQKRLAKELGVSDAKLRSATQGAGIATVESLKASGQLKAGRAAKLEKAIKAGRGAPFTQLGRARKGGAPLRLVAKAIGVKPKALRASLKAGKTPSQVITEAGKDPAAVKATVKATVRQRLDKRVKAGRITVAQADARAEKVAARVTGDQPLKR